MPSLFREKPRSVAVELAIDGRIADAVALLMRRIESGDADRAEVSIVIEAIANTDSIDKATELLSRTGVRSVLGGQKLESLQRFVAERDEERTGAEAELQTRNELNLVRNSSGAIAISEVAQLDYWKSVSITPTELVLNASKRSERRIPWNEVDSAQLFRREMRFRRFKRLRFRYVERVVSIKQTGVARRAVIDVTRFLGPHPVPDLMEREIGRHAPLEVDAALPLKFAGPWMLLIPIAMTLATIFVISKARAGSDAADLRMAVYLAVLTVINWAVFGWSYVRETRERQEPPRATTSQSEVTALSFVYGHKD